MFILILELLTEGISLPSYLPVRLDSQKGVPRIPLTFCVGLGTNRARSALPPVPKIHSLSRAEKVEICETLIRPVVT
jgi:hypothetical protein